MTCVFVATVYLQLQFTWLDNNLADINFISVETVYRAYSHCVRSKKKAPDLEAPLQSYSRQFFSQHTIFYWRQFNNLNHMTILGLIRKKHSGLRVHTATKLQYFQFWIKFVFQYSNIKKTSSFHKYGSRCYMFDLLWWHI